MSSSGDIVVEQRIEASPSVVYRCLIESNQWMHWMLAESAQIEAEPGGVFSVTMPNGMNARGEFVRVEHDRSVVFTWGWVGHDDLPPGSTTVEIVLTEDGDATLLTLTHSALPVDERELHDQGWRANLDRLATIAKDWTPCRASARSKGASSHSHRSVAPSLIGESALPPTSPPIRRARNFPPFGLRPPGGQ